MKKELQAKQAMVFRKFHTSLKEFHNEVKDLLNEDPNDQVNLELADLHNRCATQLLRSIQVVLAKANRNFLKVVENEDDTADVPTDV